MNRKAFNRINYGLFIIGAAGEGQPQGCVVNSLHQISSSMPFKFSLTVNKSNETFKAIEAAGSFAATVLAKDAPKALVDLFGYKSGRVVNKFDGLDVGTDGSGATDAVSGASKLPYGPKRADHLMRRADELARMPAGYPIDL